MALLTTFATTPLASVFYPPWYQKKLEAWKRGELDWDTGEAIAPGDSTVDDANLPKQPSGRISRLLVYLRLDNMPAVLGLVSLFGVPSASVSHIHPADKKRNSSQSLSADDTKPVRAHGIRLLQLTDRDSSVMTVSQVDQESQHDPLVNIFRTAGQFHKVAVSGEVAVMPETRFAEALLSKSSDISADLLLVPWSETGSLGDTQGPSNEIVSDMFASPYTAFIKSVLKSTQHNLAIFVTKADNGAAALSPTTERPKSTRAYSFNDIHHDLPAITVTDEAHHIFLPYFGGSDDKLALQLVLQLCERQDVTATVVHFAASTESARDDYFGFISTHVPTKLAERVRFETASLGDTVGAVLARASSEIQPQSRDTTWKNLIVLGRRSGEKLAEGKDSHELAEEIQRCLGIIGGHFVASSIKASLLVVQAKDSTVVE